MSASPSEAAANLTAQLATLPDAAVTAIMIVAGQVLTSRGIQFARQDNPHLLIAASEAISRGELEVQAVVRIPNAVEIMAVIEAGEPALSLHTFSLPSTPRSSDALN